MRIDCYAEESNVYISSQFFVCFFFFQVSIGIVSSKLLRKWRFYSITKFVEVKHVLKRSYEVLKSLNLRDGIFREFSGIYVRNRVIMLTLAK